MQRGKNVPPRYWSVRKNNRRMLVSHQPKQFLLRIHILARRSIVLTTFQPMLKRMIYENFINDLGVHLISCFKVAPRRPAWWDKNKEYKPNRNTFRVCIPKHESDKLLNEDIWPEFISISTWIFKNTSLSIGSATRRQQPSSPTRSMFQSKSSEQAGAVALSNRWSALDDQPDSDSDYSVTVINRDVDDMETTVHYEHGADQ